MRTIMLINSKGGSGKSTLATNLASYFACWGIRVTLVDFDRQGSALDWLHARPADRPEIRSVAAVAPSYPVPDDSDYRVLDVPSGVHDEQLTQLLQLADTVVIPVLPSPMDIRATGRFVAELLANPAYAPDKRVCVVANRVREQTRSYRVLEEFLEKLGIPFVAHLRDTQNYIRAAEQGLGIFELPRREVLPDLAQWQPLVVWLAGDRRLSLIPPMADVETPPQTTATHY